MAESESDFRIIINNTPYLALTDKLWGVYCEHLEEKLPQYNGTALYMATLKPCWYTIGEALYMTTLKPCWYTIGEGDSKSVYTGFNTELNPSIEIETPAATLH